MENPSFDFEPLSPPSSYGGPSLQEIRKHALEVKLNGKIYLIFKIEDDEVIPLPRQNIEKIKKVATLAIDTHQTAATQDLTLQGRELIHIDSQGSHYAETSALLDHSQAAISNHQDYLTATDDFAWQQETLDLMAQLNQYPLNSQIPNHLLQNISSDFRTYFQRQRTNNPSSVGALKASLLQYTKQKIRNTHGVHIRANPSDPNITQDKLNGWDVLTLTKIEDVINRSNDLIDQHFKANDLWQTLVELTNTPSHASPFSTNNPSSPSRSFFDASDDEDSDEEEEEDNLNFNHVQSLSSSHTPGGHPSPSSSVFITQNSSPFTASQPLSLSSFHSPTGQGSSPQPKLQEKTKENQSEYLEHVKSAKANLENNTKLSPEEEKIVQKIIQDNTTASNDFPILTLQSQKQTVLFELERIINNSESSHKSMNL
jgi:hypothetical protein